MCDKQRHTQDLTEAQGRDDNAKNSGGKRVSLVCGTIDMSGRLGVG